MPLGMSDLFKKLFCRPVTSRLPSPLRTRLGVTALEARVVPAVVTVERIADATEAGSDGLFRFTRTETSGGLSVGVTFSGTAVWGTDHGDGEPFQIAFLNGQATADLPIVATDDTATEGTE